MPAEPGRTWRCVMIAVPVFSPGGDLQRTEPPDVLAGIHALRKSGLEMQEAVHEGLHVKAVDKPDRAHPEESSPSEQEVPERNRKKNERSLESSPDQITRPNHVRTPLF